MRLYPCICMHVCLCMQMCVCMCVCVCLYVHINTCVCLCHKLSVTMPTLCPALHRLPLCDPRASLCDHSPPSVEREVKAQGRHGLRTTWLFRGRPTGLCLSDHEAPLPPGLRPLLSALLRLGSRVLRLHRPPQGPPGAFCRWVWGRCGGGVGLTDSAALPSQAKLGE